MGVKRSEVEALLRNEEHAVRHYLGVIRLTKLVLEIGDLFGGFDPEEVPSTEPEAPEPTPRDEPFGY